MQFRFIICQFISGGETTPLHQAVWTGHCQVSISPGLLVRGGFITISIFLFVPGHVSPVMDQGDCNSCAAHAAVSSVESCISIATSMMPKSIEFYCINISDTEKLECM